MKINIKKIKYIFNKNKKDRHVIANVSRDWEIVVGVFLIINLVIVFFGWRLSFVDPVDTFHGEQVEHDDDIIVETFNRNDMGTVLTTYRQKKNSFNNIYLSGKGSIKTIDPSL